MTFIQAAGRTPLKDIESERTPCGVCEQDLSEGPATDAPALPRGVEVEVLDLHPVIIRSHRDKADVDATDLYGTGVRRGERVEESLSHTVRVIAPQALEIGTHDHRSKLGHPGGVGENARSKAPLRCHVEKPIRSQ